MSLVKMSSPVTKSSPATKISPARKNSPVKKRSLQMAQKSRNPVSRSPMSSPENPDLGRKALQKAKRTSLQTAMDSPRKETRAQSRAPRMRTFLP
ncbi:MAG: hypothetical protein LUD50_08315 [Clostridia bacterium]|nr:hypothetical protein [Clostridia bacterium]